MKRAVFFSMFLWMGIMGAMAQGYHYDVNYDDKVTITDATLIVNKILGKANAGEVEGLQEVDLGLPSGTIWASINVGASSPEEIGNYYAWGETVGKINYALDTYQYYNDGAYQNIYDLTGDISGTSYDVATALWGKEWCMPTKEQFEELVQNCEWNQYESNGVWGLKFTSKTNGNSIFLPYTGYKENGSVNESTEVHCWTSVPYNDLAYECFFRLGPRQIWRYSLGETPRYLGLPVRPVRAPKTPSPKAIDLGLPSGTKWANFNVGASKPEDYGGYFAWGETEEKLEYSRANYKYYVNGNYQNFGNNISGTSYDVAHVKWGGNWCMPTWEDFRELVEYTTSEWITYNGVTGRKFTSKTNGNSIFLPAAGGSFVETILYGLYYMNAGISHVRVKGKYWLASRYAPNTYDGYYPDDAISTDDAFWIVARQENAAEGGTDYYTHDKDMMCQYELLWYAKSVRPVYKE